MGCEASEQTTPEAAWRGVDSTYVFEDPDDVFTLDKDLKEISGMTMMENGLLATVQDENGILYIIDPTSGEIVEQRKFGKDGDYEGLERGGGHLFILRSDGRVYVFDESIDEEFVGDSYDLDLVKGCDAEGIGYQADRERLLISCKERAGKNLDGKKAIFAYDPATQILTDEPVYLFDIEAFEASIEDHPINEAVRSVLQDHVDVSGFKPSGLAIHPRSGDLYVVSSVTKVVVRMDDAGQVTGMWDLPADLFPQPEAIAFGPDGDLFISSEAGNRKNATLVRFRDRSSGISPAPSNE